MEQKNRPVLICRRTLGQVAATAAFLLVAGLILYACVVLAGGMLRREMVKSAPDPLAVQPGPSTPSPSASAAPTEPLQNAAAIRVFPTPTPQAGTTGIPGMPGIPPSAFSTLDDTPTPRAASTPTPAPTLLPLESAKPFSASRAEFVLLGLDKNDNPDWIAVVQMYDNRCRVLSVPRNTLYNGQKTLASSLGANQTRRRLTAVWPVDYPYYVNLALADLPQCVDVLGGVTLNHARCTGEQVAAYLANADSDELLRIARQQDVMRASLDTLRNTSYLTLLTSKFKLEQSVWSNLSTLQLLAIFQHFKSIPPAQITFATLPVDSVTLDGARCYAPDANSVNRLLTPP